MSRFDSNGNKVHSSRSAAGTRIIFLASGAVSPTKGDKQSESLVRVARSATIECADCEQDFPAPAFDGNGSCPACWDDAGMENEHNDGWHEDAPNTECKQCKVCLGHADGPVMGETFFCNGTCR